MSDNIVILEITDEEMKAIREVLSVLPLSEELRAKIAEALDDAEDE